MLTVLVIALGGSGNLFAQQLLVNCDYNSSTEGYGTSKFSNYAGAYAYATANATNVTIVIEKTNTLSGNTFDNNHKNYSKLAVVIKDGATMGNAASKWDMTYPVTVEPGGTLTCARPASASVSNIHIKNKLIVGAKGATKKAYVNFLSDSYQDCDISIRYNGSIEVYNADFYIQDLDAQGKLTIEDSEVYVDGAFASATYSFYPTTLTNSTITINGNQISGGLSDFSGGTSNQLGNVKINNSTLTIKEGDTKVAANVTATNSTIAVNNLTVNSGKTLNLNQGSTLNAENITTAGTGSVKIDGVIAPIVDGAICVPVSDFAALKAAVEAGKNVQLTADITTTSAIKTEGITSVIDLNGKTLTIGAGDNKFNDESNVTIKNGNVNITGVTVKGNAIFCLDEYEKTLVSTLTFDKVNLTGDGYSSAYGIFYIGESSVLNVNGGEWNLKNDTHASGGVFKADGSGAKLNIDGLNLTAHNVRRVVTYANTTIENSTMAISGDAEGVDAEMEHGFNRSPLAISNSTITMKDMVGRGITAQNGAVTISENSNVNITNCIEATIDVRNNQTVTIDNTSTVFVDKEPTLANGCTINGTVKLPTVAKIGAEEYSYLADALEAAKSMTGDVTVEICAKVTMNQPLAGSYTSIKFVGPQTRNNTDAEIYLDVQGYITATGKKVAFENLKLSKSEGGFIANAGFMNVAFGIFDVAEVSYTNCTFLNGACASFGKVTYTGCTFKKSWDKYGLWAYGNVDVTVNNCIFADYRGIKMYAENGANASVEKPNLVVKNTNFSAVQGEGSKPAIVLTYGESVTLEGNTYSSTGVFELDLDGAPNGVTVTSDVAPTCVNDNGACGVLVDGKIYTTVAQAAEVATSGSTVTLLHNSTETVELPYGVNLDKNGFGANGVTVAPPAAKIGDDEYATLSAAFAAVTADDQTVVVCKDVTENLTGAYLRGNITTENNVKVTITLTNSDWVYCPYTFILGENITLDVPALFYYAGGTQIYGTVVAGAYYQRYAGTKLTINEPGSMTVTSETCIIRYMDNDPNAGIYVVGDNNDETVGLKLSVAYFYQGMINAKDANIVAGTYWQTNETDAQGSANLVLDNSTLTVTVYDHPAKATGNSTVTLTNGSVIDARNGGFTYDEVNARLSIDATSKIIGKNGVEVKLPVAKINDTKYYTLEDAFKAATSGCEINIINNVTVDYAWDARYTGAKFTVPVTINGNGNTIKFTASVNDNNYQAPFRFEADATVKGLTIDMSETTDSRFRAISSKGNLTVDGCTFIGKDATLNCRAIIFGEGAGANAGNLAISITDSKFINWKRGITDNENGQDVKTVTITGNNLKNSAVYVSAKETVTFTDNTVEGAYVDIRSYSADNALNVTATDNTLEQNTASAYNYIKAGGTVDAQVEFKLAPVAKIGNVEYTTLAEAFEAAVEGDVVRLLINTTLAKELTTPAGITIDGNGKQINGTIYAGGNLTFVGHTKVTAFSASYYNCVITIGEGACLEITGGGRVSLAYGNTFNITGSIENAKTADKANVQASLIIPAGISITGGNDAAMNVTNAYVQIGSTTSKNSAANGTFTMNFTNSIVEFTKEFALAEPTSGKNPTFNMNIKDCVLTTGTKFIAAAPNSNVVVDNSVVTLGTYFRNSGKFDIVNGSEFTGATIQFGENGGNNGALTVDASELTINASSTGHALDGKATGSITLKNGAKATIDYIKDMAELYMTADSKLYSKTADLNIQTEPSYKVVYNENDKVYETADATIYVATKAELKSAIENAVDGTFIRMTANIDYGTDQLAITKNINLNLGGFTLTTANPYGGMSVKGNPTIKNGTIVHASNTAAIKVWNATAFEDLVIDVQGKGDANKTIGGIVLQSGSTTRVGSIKNVTIKGAALTNGIETYNCGDATENVIGAMENVTINAQGTGMLISAPCGTATNCSIKGGVNGIEIWIKGNYSASLDLVNSKVEGGVYAHDEFNSNPGIVNNGTLSLTADENTTGAGLEDVTLTIARAENLDGVVEDVMKAAKAKIGNTYYITLAKAIAAAKAGDVVTVFEGTYAMPSMKAGITIVGEGNVLFEGTLTNTLENLTMKNIYIKGGNAQRWAYAKGDLVFENVTFEATGVYALHFDGITAGATLTYKDCTIIGWAAMSGSPESCTFDGCTFKGNGTYGLIRTYFDATIENCTFDVANVNTTDIYQDGIHAVDGATVTVNNCTNVNGNMKNVVNVGDTSVVVLDGVEIKNVAKSGDNYYLTLQGAFAAIGNGAGKTVELLDNVDLAGQEWTPIGTSENPFNGNFDGQNHTIKNLNIVVSEAKEGKAYIGLFGYAKDVNIKNVVFENVNLNIACLDIDHSQGHIGAVAGSLEGTSTIENVTVKGDITVYATQTANGASRVAVVAGGNTYGDVTMKNVHVIANEGSSLIANNNAGALAGQLQGKMYFENCSSNIDVTVNKFFAGGLIGIAAGDSYFKNCHTTGNVAVVAGREGRANDHYRVGGIAGGWADGKNKVCTLVNCSYEGAVSGKNADGSVAGTLDYDGYVGRGYTLTNCAGSKVVIDDVEHVQVYDDVYGFYKVGDVYEISSLATLKAFRDKVNAGDNYNGKTVVLTADINFIQTRSEESNWTPIGTSANPFKGTFDGKDHTISNLVINGGSKSNQGFFGTTQNGEIKNVTFKNAMVSGRLNVGVVAGQPYTSKYTNVKVTGHVKVNGMAYVGGVGGKNAYANWTDITVDVDTDSYVKANSVENGTAYRTYVGGVVGFNGEGGHTFANISSNIKVIGSTCDIGGIFGIAHYSNKFENITFTGAVEAPADAEEVGGIAGVWHNQVGTSVTFTEITSTGTVTIGAETTTGSIVGGAYNASNETADNSGSLIIDGVEAWLKVAQVGEVKYLTLAEAVAAVTENTTITMLADVELTSTVTVAKDQVVTLDLNGKTISAAITEQLTKSFAAICNKGTLTVKDSATTRAAGKITVSYEGASFGYGVGLYTISNEGGTLNIESGIVENTTTVSGSMYDAIDNNSTTGNTVLNILGGEVKCQYIGVRQFANSTTHENIVNVTGGKVVGGNTSIWMQNPGSNQPKATIAISGDANIEGRLLAGTSTGFTFNVTGGTFTVDPQAFCAAGYTAKDNYDGTYTVKQTAGTLTRTLPEGWSWFSSYVDLYEGVEGDGLAVLENALGENGVQIKDNAGQAYVNYSNGRWRGSLATVSSETMYAIKTSAEHTLEITGEFYDINEYEVSLRNGWNYLSYPHYEAMPVVNALGFTPANGDAIKGKGVTAFYLNNSWIGAFSLTPGEGYMYYSNEAGKEFSYSTEETRSSVKSYVSESSEYWTVDASQYPSNMTMIATLDVEGADYEVAAFVDGEVRGSARPIYVDFLDQYIVVMTINGENVANVTFKYYDFNAGEEYDLNNVAVYSNNAILGSVNNPYALTRGTTGIGEATLSDINIYPNPTTTDREINLQATCDKVEVFNTLGVKVAEYQNVDTIDALETAGTYVIRVTLNGDVKHCRLVVK